MSKGNFNLIKNNLSNQIVIPLVLVQLAYAAAKSVNAGCVNNLQ